MRDIPAFVADKSLYGSRGRYAGSFGQLTPQAVEPAQLARRFGGFGAFGGFGDSVRLCPRAALPTAGAK